MHYGNELMSYTNVFCKSTVPNVGTRRDPVTISENAVCAEFAFYFIEIN